VLIVHAGALWQTGAPEEGERLLRAALSLVGGGSERASAAALLALGWLEMDRARFALAAAAFAEARARAVDDSQRGEALLGESHALRSDFASQAELARRSIACFQRAGMPVSAARAQCRLGIALRVWGKNDGARAAFEAAIDTLQRVGTPSCGPRIDLCRKLLALMDGDLQTQIDLSRRVVERQRASGVSTGLSRSLSVLGNLLAQAGRTEEAHEALNEAGTLAAEAGQAQTEAVIAKCVGELLASEGQLEAAEAELRRSCTLLEDVERGVHLIDALCALAVVQHRRGRTADSERALARAAALAESLELRPESVFAQAIERAILALQAPAGGRSTIKTNV
jgi:tetratricopeptide (TPR) repeat protein